MSTNICPCCNHLLHIVFCFLIYSYFSVFTSIVIDISVIDITFRDVRVVTLVVKVKTRIELRIGGW